AHQRQEQPEAVVPALHERLVTAVVHRGEQRHAQRRVEPVIPEVEVPVPPELREGERGQGGYNRGHGSPLMLRIPEFWAPVYAPAEPRRREIGFADLPVRSALRRRQ